MKTDSTSPFLWMLSLLSLRKDFLLISVKSYIESGGVKISAPRKTTA
jgi:hypothetical protein